MTLYQIDQAILDAIERGTDPETGEMTNADELMQLQMDRVQKLENIACVIKNAAAEAKALKEEADALIKRRKTAENTAERLKAVLAEALGGERFSTPRCSVSYRNSKAVEVEDADAVMTWACKEGREDEFIRYKDPEINKTALGDWLKSGGEVPGAHIVERRSIGVR